MRRFILLLFSIIVLLFIIAYWHCYEDNEVMQLNQELRDIDIVGVVHSDWTAERIKEYQDSLVEDIYDRFPPKCPYCWYESLTAK